MPNSDIFKKNNIDKYQLLAEPSIEGLNKKRFLKP